MAQKRKSLKSKKKQVQRKRGNPNWKKGQSANPKGRPLGSRNFKGAYAAISQLLAGPVQFPGGVSRMLTGNEQVALKVFMKAKHGDVRAAKMLEDRQDGMPAQTMRTISEGKKLRIIFDEGAKNDPTPLPNEEGSDGESDDG